MFRARRKRFFKRRRFNRKPRMYKAPMGFRKNTQDVTFTYPGTFGTLIPSEESKLLDTPSFVDYAGITLFVGKDLMKTGINWSSLVSMYSFCRPVSLYGSFVVGIQNTTASFLNQGVFLYDKSQRTDGFSPVPSPAQLKVVFAQMATTLGSRLIANADTRLENKFSFKVPFIQKLALPDTNDQDAFDKAFGALTFLLNGRFDATIAAFGTISIRTKVRFYNRR
jgi:hypothetical protein|nr:MAG: capsid protein [Cressdnaviricota sp.]